MSSQHPGVKGTNLTVTLPLVVIHDPQPFGVQKDLAGFGFAKVAPPEVFRKISQNFSPAGVTSPFVARAIPTDNTSVVPVSGRYLGSESSDRIALANKIAGRQPTKFSTWALAHLQVERQKGYD
jgi:hypothetical protein